MGCGAQTWFWSLVSSVKKAYTYHKEKNSKQGLYIHQWHFTHIHTLTARNRYPETTQVPVTPSGRSDTCSCVSVFTVGLPTSQPLCFYPASFPLLQPVHAHILSPSWLPSGLPVVSARPASSSESWEMIGLQHYLVRGLIHTPTVINSIFFSALKTAHVFWL